MTTKYECDMCGKDISSSNRRIFVREHRWLDLCDDCYRGVLEFLKVRPNK